MSDESKLVGANGEKLVITPEEAKERIRSKGIPDGGKGGKYSISRAEAVSIATQVGQQVYDQLRAEHALAMGQLQEDLRKHFNGIREVTALNILDIQRRSFSYRLRRDFAWDRKKIAIWVAARWELLLAWLELRGLKQPKQTPVIPITADPSVPPDEVHFRDPEGRTTKIVNLQSDETHIGAPTELPEAPEIARTLTLSE